jgi:hypothetical protein
MACRVMESLRLASLRLICGINPPALSMACHLYRDDYTPRDSDNLDRYTLHECDYSGYAPQPVVWVEPPEDANGSGFAVANMLVFGADADPPVTNSVYGYYVSATIDMLEVLLFAERLPNAPISIAKTEDVVVVGLVLSSRSLFHP